MVGIAIGTTTAGATIGITVGTRSARPWALPLAWLRFLSAGNQRLRWLSVLARHGGLSQSTSLLYFGTCRCLLVDLAEAERVASGEYFALRTEGRSDCQRASVETGALRYESVL